jgi:hypothetical protein
MVEKTEQVAWNLSIELLREIGSLLNKSSSFMLMRHPDKSFEALYCVRSRVIQSLTKDERETLDKMEEKIRSYIILNSEEIEETSPVLWNKVNKLLYHSINEYNISLMDMLNKYGYLLQKKEDTTKMSA